MRRLLPLAVLFVSASLAAADDPFTMELSARADTQQQTAHGQPASSPASAHPVLSAKSKTKLRIRWSIVNQQKAGAIAGVTIHFVLDKANSPNAHPDAVYESALNMDFAPQATSSADFFVYAPEPGTYLLRLETIGAAGSHGHEHAADMDLKVLP